jgi:hypothetical protein
MVHWILNWQEIQIQNQSLRTNQCLLGCGVTEAQTFRELLVWALVGGHAVFVWAHCAAATAACRVWRQVLCWHHVFGAHNLLASWHALHLVPYARAAGRQKQNKQNYRNVTVCINFNTDFFYSGKWENILTVCINFNKKISSSNREQAPGGCCRTSSCPKSRPWYLPERKKKSEYRLFKICKFQNRIFPMAANPSAVHNSSANIPQALVCKSSVQVDWQCKCSGSNYMNTNTHSNATNRTLQSRF